jgi:Tripartite tricarboxylate transporter TctB family
MEESTKRLRSLDFFMGTGFALIGLYVMSDGYKTFISPALVTVEKSVNPGVTSLFIGGSLALLGLILAVIGLRGSGNPFLKAVQVIPETLRKKSFLRGVLAMSCIGVYFFVLWGRMPYVLSTFIFLGGMMFLFKGGAWWKIFLISGVTVAIIWYLFGVLAMIPLP